MSDKPKVLFPNVDVIEYIAPGDEIDHESKGVVASTISINGVEFHCPEDAKVIIEASNTGLTKLTATIFVGRTTIEQRVSR